MPKWRLAVGINFVELNRAMQVAMEEVRADCQERGAAPLGGATVRRQSQLAIGATRSWRGAAWHRQPA